MMFTANKRTGWLQNEQEIQILHEARVAECSTKNFECVALVCLFAVKSQTRSLF